MITFASSQGEILHKKGKYLHTGGKGGYVDVLHDENDCYFHPLWLNNHLFIMLILGLNIVCVFLTCLIFGI